ncbi:glyoxalase [Nocardia vermiculata]|uniref:Glyoxalase n=1 Tax=Nocardia vermiculata TaxID=257274 RepID=A0A846XV99_9NOCA|nr:glyoxalase [Nocardia vermiculata]NKY51053.1 glyoxalase [Nocardia vermiculata]
MNITADQSTIEAITIEAADATSAAAFYDSAFGLGDRLRVCESQEPTSGFRGCVLSLVVAQPGVVDSYFASAVAAGATVIKPAKKSFWGYGGVLQAPDGTLWKIATSAKKDSEPVQRKVDEFVILLGVDNVKATKQFYVERGLTVGKSYGSKYVDFEAPEGSIKLALYGRRAAAKDAGVPPEGTGSHRVVFAGGVGAFTDPDGFVWTIAA